MTPDELADKITPPNRIFLQWHGDDGSIDCSALSEPETNLEHEKE